MRWKADLPKMPRLPKVPLEAGDPNPGELGPPPAPSDFRAKNPLESKPADYNAPSMLVEHRGLALLFLAAVIAFGLYCWKAPRRAVSRDASAAAPAAQSPASAPAESPIYVEAVPDKDR
jgi:hypothetical protein